MTRNDAEPQPAGHDAVTYSVEVPHAVEAPRAVTRAAFTGEPKAAPAPSGKTAVLVVHGMGEQQQFQTLTDVADGLRQASVRLGGTPSGIVARAVGAGDERLQRMELTLSNGQATRAVHVYEAYWAPITEGEVTLRDVIRFLLTAGWNGLWHSWRPFKRYLDQQYVKFPVPVRTPLYLITALLATLSLVVMNAAIVGLSALRAPLKVAPPWATPVLFRDVTAVLDVFVVAAVVFGAALLPSCLWRLWLKGARMRKWRALNPKATIVPVLSRLFGAPSLLGFILLLTVTVAAGGAIPLVIYFHVKQAAASPDALSSILDLAFGRTLVDFVLSHATRLLLWLSGLAVAAMTALLGFRILRGLVGAVQARKTAKQFWLTGVVLGGVAAITAGSAMVVARLVAQIHPGGIGRIGDIVRVWGPSLVWVLAIGVSAFARWFLVEFLGDVAAYVEPEQLDRFNTLRERLKTCVWNKARAVYLLPEGYDEIVLVGHSLGSVIGYDILNRLYREEALGTVPDVQRRSQLFVTFGSPLDKTAFLFAIQGSNREGREALAASVQPLIGFPAKRPRWVNVYSGWDIISGSLDFYDSPGGLKQVDNQSDPEACVWLAAHTQYWDGQLIFDTIHRHLVA